MKTINELMQSYASYHRDPRNKATHFIGVPMIIYALLIPLGWFQFLHPEMLSFPLTGATVFIAGMTFYYLVLDRLLALLQLPVSLVLLYFAGKVSLWPFAESLGMFFGAFFVGWVIQFLGHYFEGRRPAVFDNLLQAFNAPLFLTMEALFLLGFRRDMRFQIEGPDTVRHGRLNLH